MKFLPSFRTMLNGLLIAVTSGLLSGRVHALETYEIPALSSIKRLPNALPPDVKGKGAIHFVAAKGEFEPASFLIAPDQTLEGVELKASDLKSKDGVIPAQQLDLKLVKVWYQDGTAWNSYFADPTRKELVPELLLNDDKLIQVDHEKKGNYLRVGESYRWISYRAEEAEEFFNYLEEPVADAETLQPFTLTAGANQQIWVTLKVPKDAAPGVYRGTIALRYQGRDLGEVSVIARVLPFELPAPKTYHNPDSDFFVTIYRTGMLDLAARLGVPREHAMEIQRKLYRNLTDHNVRNPRSEVSQHTWRNDPAKGLAILKDELTLLKESGAVTNPLLAGEPTWLTNEERKTPEIFHKRFSGFLGTVKEVIGETEVYATNWDEAGYAQIRTMRDEASEMARYPGVKLWITTSPQKHFNLAGYLYDYANHSGWPNREEAAIWHSIDSKVASYASPHTGPENPDTFRRWEGLARYKQNYDGSFNYKYYSALHPTIYKRQKANVWNDSTGGTFRAFNMIYPTRNGPIDTIAWEGFREGIDDIRYATLLKQKAAKAMKSEKQSTKHLARKALMWLELTEMDRADLNAVRQEMINYILEIDELLK